MLGISAQEINQGIFDNMFMILSTVPWWLWVAALGVGILKTKAR
jgi:hypothetical protein